MVAVFRPGAHVARQPRRTTDVRRPCAGFLHVGPHGSLFRVRARRFAREDGQLTGFVRTPRRDLLRQRTEARVCLRQGCNQELRVHNRPYTTIYRVSASLNDKI